MNLRKSLLVLSASALLLVGCGGPKEEDLKLGVGAVISGISYAKDAKSVNSIVVAQIDVAIASVILDSSDKVVSAYIDEIQIPVSYDATAKKVSLNKTKTQTKDAGDKVVESKKELGTRYGMTVASGIKKDWFEQAAFLENYYVGKKVAALETEVKNDHTVAADKDLYAGCTMAVKSYSDAMLEASKTTRAFKGTKDAKAGVGIVIDPNGSHKADLVQFDLSFASVASEGDVIKGALVDCFQFPLLNATGGLKNDATQVKDAGDKLVESKKELGTRYGMTVASPIKKDWFEQAAYLEERLAGKKAADLVLTKDGKADDKDILAGCTIALGDTFGSVKEGLANRK